jgi:hypothetical protein
VRALKARLNSLELYAALEAPLFHGAAGVRGGPSEWRDRESRGQERKQRQEQSQRQRTRVSAPHGRKQVTHRAWRPVRNDRELLSSRFAVAKCCVAPGYQ